MTQHTSNETERDWPEDFPHENGCYTCKACAAPAASAPPMQVAPSEALDAQRYRWLRANNIVANVRLHFASGDSPYLYAEALDEAIDSNCGLAAPVPQVAPEQASVRDAALEEHIANLVLPSEAKLAMPVPVNDEERAALERFHECVTDGEGWDVPKAMMQRLARIGLVRRVTANLYEHTEFGLAVLDGLPTKQILDAVPAPQAPPWKDLNEYHYQSIASQAFENDLKDEAIMAAILMTESHLKKLNAAAPVPQVAPEQASVLVPIAELELISSAMEHMGNKLNEMDVVEPEDLENTQGGFDAIRIMTSKYPKCTFVLRSAGRAYPRTCAECGFGPCKQNLKGGE